MAMGMKGKVFVRNLLLLLLALALALSACAAPQPTTTVGTDQPGSALQPSFTPRPTFTITPPVSPTPAGGTNTATPLPSPTPVVGTETIAPAEAGTALPAAREAIIESNLVELRELARWGNGQVEAMTWSPDGAQLAVSTTLGVYLYDANSLAQQAFFQTNGPASRPVFSPDSSHVAASISMAGEVGATAVLEWSTRSLALVQTLPAPGQALALAYDPANGGLLALTRLERGQQRGATFSAWNASGELVNTRELIGGETAAAAAFSPDLKLAATHGREGPVRLWQLSDGANFATTQEAGLHAGPLAFSPDLQDGQTLAVGYIDVTRDYRNQNEIRVWRVPEPGEVHPATLLYSLSDSIRPGGGSLAEGMEQVLLSLAWSPSGKHIAAGYEDRTVRVWKAASSDPYRRLAAATLPFGLAWAPGGERLAAGGIEIFQLSDSARLVFSNDFLPGLYDLALSPSGNYLALAGYNQIEVRRVSDGQHAYTITGMVGPVNDVDISPSLDGPDSELLAAACQDGTTRLYRLSDGHYLASLGVAGQPVLSAAFSANGRWVASGNESMQVQIFRVEDRKLMLTVQEPYVAYRLLFSPNVDQLASLTTSGVWLRSFSGEIQKITTELEGMAGGVGLNDIAYSPGEEFLALVGNGVVRVIDPATRADQYVLSAQASNLSPDTQPWAAAFSPDNAFLAVGWSDGAIRIYWAADGALMATRPAHPDGWNRDSIVRLRFSGDGRLLLSLGAEGTIRLWGVANP